MLAELGEQAKNGTNFILLDYRECQDQEKKASRYAVDTKLYNQKDLIPPRNLRQRRRRSWSLKGSIREMHTYISPAVHHYTWCRLQLWCLALSELSAVPRVWH
ncbi:hypothetical protein PMIN02_009716 [Paraphaeosphaeria minitans]